MQKYAVKYADFLLKQYIIFYSNIKMDEQSLTEKDIIQIDYEKIHQEELEKWKIKLKNVIYCKTFCGVCLEENHKVWNVDAAITIVELGPEHECTLIQLLAELFGDYVRHFPLQCCNDLLLTHFTDLACIKYFIYLYIFY